MTESKIIAICGYEGSGKSTSASFIASALARNGHTVKIISFAAPIKELCKKYMKLDKSIDGANWRRGIEIFSMDMRRMLGNDIFTKYTMNEIEHSLYDYYIIDDMRYASELEALHASAFATYILKTRTLEGVSNTDADRFNELMGFIETNKIDIIELPAVYDDIYGFVNKFVDLVT